MNIEAEIKQHENNLVKMQSIVKANNKDFSASRTKFTLAKKKLFSQLKFFSSLTIDEIMANDEKVEDKQHQMDVQLKKIKDMYEKYISLGQVFEQKQEAMQKLNDEYEKEEEVLANLEEQEEETAVPVSTNKFAKLKKKKL